MAPKRKASISASPEPNSKRAALSNGMPRYHPAADVAEQYGIVLRNFYPPEISNEKCKMYTENKIPRPAEVLEKTLADTAARRNDIEVGDAVVFWFKRDLRLHDNKPLRMASDKAESKGVPLICVFFQSSEDLTAHLCSASRVDFVLRSLAILKEDLAKLNIPLLVENVLNRKALPNRLLEVCQTSKIKHVFCGIEYEVDELRRETLLTKKCLENNISFTAVHDDVIIKPGDLWTGTGKQYAVYSPWYRAWKNHIHNHPHILNGFEPPAANPATAKHTYRDLFEAGIPEAPETKRLTEEEKSRFKSLWPAGEYEAIDRLNKFIRERVGNYNEARNLPAANATALLSVHFAAGTLSPRTAVRMARDTNSTKKLDGGKQGIVSWISEVAWRDFYKHVLVHWPFICMNKAFKFETADIKWGYNMEWFERWKEGKTGFPIVDAAMRQCLYMGYIHNRCRMIVASFLTKDLLLDWRLGEQHFMLNLIDGDFASNNGGWGFSASTGVDGQPYFRIFNCLLQSEKFDPDGEYIRKWIPELNGIKGKAVHDPYGRGMGKEAEKRGYPRAMVDHAVQRKKALEMYKNQ